MKSILISYDLELDVIGAVNIFRGAAYPNPKKSAEDLYFSMKDDFPHRKWFIISDNEAEIMYTAPIEKIGLLSKAQHIEFWIENLNFIFGAGFVTGTAVTLLIFWLNR